MAILITLWGIRLSYNFARKGGFSYDPTGKRWVLLDILRRMMEFFGKKIHILELGRSVIEKVITEHQF